MLTTREFYQHDFLSSLFPMETCRLLIEHGSQEIEAYIQRCLSQAPANSAHQFLAQTRVYASKPANHLRRTVKLDPIAEYFIYDLTFRNRAKFRKPFHDDKKHFGYRFENGEPIAATSSYMGFKGAISKYSSDYSHSLSFDVAAYFNNIYHHDLVAWFANLGASQEDIDAFGSYLRQTNSGRSIDCLAQGLYPTKMIGNDFLRFVEQHHSLKSSAVVRFMDDIILFSNEPDSLYEDFYSVQKLLGQKGLSVNPSKTKSQNPSNLEKEANEVKLSLLNKRRKAALLDYMDEVEAAADALQLTPQESDYIRALLAMDNLQEEDAELILSIFRDHAEEVKPHLANMTASFPHLSKNLWSFLKHLKDASFMGEVLLDLLQHPRIQEFQLFWFGWILQDYLMDTTEAPKIIEALYTHKNATTISKAKLLEIPDNRFGLVELRDEHLVAGRSDWLAWSSAVGHRTLPKISRNHKLEYFGNSSQINHLIKTIISAV
ncbi:RNA-directed DNA polymerase [Hyphomonas sp. WL0036]|uniref:antiviral reverse transcriptase Drt5 n=1 Tax=Hyphomonas sediminis TaxID=2866160 RepID=UPI001C7F404A|nr:RNA-directed DNA polymerase [Hyphomonas sediminis]